MRIDRLQRRIRLGFDFSQQNKIESFSKWAANEVAQRPFDVIYSWSSISGPLFNQLHSREKTLCLLARGSTHIAYQEQILREESKRVGVELSRPSPWLINLEKLEYEIADAVVVLSTHCRNTFIDRGVPPGKIITMIAGVDAKRFLAPKKTVESRILRMRSREPLHILMSGSFDFRKGAWDIAEVVRQLGNQNVLLRFVGSISPSCQYLKHELQSLIEFVPRVSQAELVDQFAWADVFFFPSLEEGLPQTLIQAAAAGCYLLSTPNAAMEDILQSGGIGRSIEMRDIDEYVSTFQDLIDRKSEHANSLSSLPPQVRTWDHAAIDLVQKARERLDR